MSVSEPGKIITPWAESGLKNTIPPAANPATGRAGFDQGFSAINMTAKEAGGIPPFGQDFNGIFYEVTNILRYMQAGGQPTFDTALATAIGGYPKGAMVLGSDGVAIYTNRVDGNSSNPNSGGSGWAREDLMLREALRRSYAEAGYNLVDGSFEVGGTLPIATDVLLQERTGVAYSWSGVFPKVVSAGSTPATSGGIGDGAWVDRTDVTLRSDLNVVVKVFESVADMVADVALIVGQKCRTLGYYAVGDGGGNHYEIVAAATGTNDGGSYIDLYGSGFQAKGFFGAGFATPKQFGAYGDGLSDDTLAIRNAIAFSDVVHIQRGNYRTTSDITHNKGTSSTKTTIIGDGIGVSVITLDHYVNGIQILGNQTDLTEVHISGISVRRNNPDAYIGSIGPKSILVRYSKNSTIDDTEESGAIGFGIQFWNSKNATVRNCYVHDHKGGKSGPTGTDGIHFYVCDGATAVYNKVENVGDDAISFGSFDSANPTKNITCHSNKITGGGGGGVKHYAYVENSSISKNIISNVINGAVYLTDDASSPANARLNNISITDNLISDCSGVSGNFEGGGVRLRLWNGVTSAEISDITIKNNHIVRCRTGVVAWSYNSTKRFKNLSICDNYITDAPAVYAGDNSGIRIIQCDGILNISKNTIKDCAATPIDLNHVNGGYSAVFDNAVVSIDDNVINNYSMEVSSGTAYRGVWVRYGSNSLICNIRRNVINGQKTGNGITADRAILTSTISPLSVCEFNTDDGSGTGFQIGSQAAYKGNDKLLGSLPTSGTHYDNQKVYNYTPTSGQPQGWVCKTKGTFGTLVGVTGSMTAGEKTLVVNDATNIYKGCVLSVAGAVTSAIVMSVSGTTITLNAAASGTVSGVAVSYVTPVFVTMPNYA